MKKIATSTCGQDTVSKERQKTIYYQELVFIYSQYNEIIKQIIYANNENMPYVPFSEYLKRLDKCMYVEPRCEELNKTVELLKTQLQELAKAFQYIHKDNNGFLCR